MKPTAGNVVSARGQRVAKHFGRLIERARLARGDSQRDLAERARVSLGTIRRMETGETGVALWAWLNAMEALGVIRALEQLRDPSTDALLDANLPKRAGRARATPDLDF